MPGLALTSSAWVQLEAGIPVCKLRLQARADTNAWLVLALRPQNPEGISFIHQVSLSKERTAWTIDDTQRVEFSSAAARHHVSDYRHGDVYIHLKDLDDQTEGRCDVGMVTAAALFPVKAGEDAEIIATIPLASAASTQLAADAWSNVHRDHCKLTCPEPHYQFLYDAAITSLILHSPEDVYPGPYTYKRFWFRDAAFIIHALLCVGLTERAERALARFPERQTALGYFRSQEGEWDANGEVLWIVQRFFALTGQPPSPDWHNPIQRGARWIMRKRLSDDLDAPHAGLLPAGFSAEHLGPNDYYYWDDFWGIAGLRAAAAMLAEQDVDHSREFALAAEDFAAAVDRSLAACAQRLGRPAMPASPYRRLDAGAIGSLALGYPVQLCAPDDPRLLDCVEFLLKPLFRQRRVLPGHDPFRPQRLPDPARRASTVARRRPAPPRPDGCGRRPGLADRSVAGGDPSAHRRRLHGRRSSCVGRRRVGADDPQLFRARRRRTPDPVRGHSGALARAQYADPFRTCADGLWHDIHQHHTGFRQPAARRVASRLASQRTADRDPPARLRAGQRRQPVRTRSSSSERKHDA